VADNPGAAPAAAQLNRQRRRGSGNAPEGAQAAPDLKGLDDALREQLAQDIALAAANDDDDQSPHEEDHPPRGTEEDPDEDEEQEETSTDTEEPGSAKLTAKLKGSVVDRNS
jgi:hypothetical protein